MSAGAKPRQKDSRRDAPLDETDLGFVTKSRDGGERHYALRVIYAHLRGVAPSLAPCRYVELGDVVGSIGASGIASQPHLHFEIIVQDPARLEGDPNLRGALNPLFLMRREPDERIGSIACYEEGMRYRPNAGEAEDSLSIIWPTLGC